MKSQFLRAAIIGLALAATALGSSSQASAGGFGGSHMGFGIGFGHGYGHGFGWRPGYGWGHGYGWGPGFGYGGDYGDECFIKRFVTDDGDIVVRRVCD